jgi:hypothetical protein
MMSKFAGEMRELLGDHPITTRWKPDPVPTIDEQRARIQARDHSNAGYAWIISSRKKHEIGDVVENFNAGYVDGDALVLCRIFQPAAVVAERTFEEWIASFPEWIPGPRPGPPPEGWHFYELHTD